MNTVVRIEDNDFYTLTLETDSEGRLFPHLELTKFNKAIYENIMTVWVDLIGELKHKGVKTLHAYASMEDEGAKELRLQMMFGFTPVGVATKHDGEQVYYCTMELE